jgi:hypothetical protein
MTATATTTTTCMMMTQDLRFVLFRCVDPLLNDDPSIAVDLQGLGGEAPEFQVSLCLSFYFLVCAHRRRRRHLYRWAHLYRHTLHFSNGALRKEFLL